MQSHNHKISSSAFIGNGCNLKSQSISIGDGTRLNGNVLIHGIGPCSIGNYCALGYNINIITSTHKINFPNIQIALQRKISSSKNFLEDASQGGVKIFNSVWIGDGVNILPGVKIHDCSIIGAGSVVYKDVEPYSIYAGNPAKFIKKRFSKTIIKVLQETKWWDWSNEKIINNKEFFELDLNLENDPNKIISLIKE